MNNFESIEYQYIMMDRSTGASIHFLYSNNNMYPTHREDRKKINLYDLRETKVKLKVKKLRIKI